MLFAGGRGGSHSSYTADFGLAAGCLESQHRAPSTRPSWPRPAPSAPPPPAWLRGGMRACWAHRALRAVASPPFSAGGPALVPWMGAQGLKAQMQKPRKSERVSNTWPSTPRKREKEAILEHLLCARPQDGHLTNLAAFIFFLIFGQAHGTWKFPDRGSNLHPSSNPSRCSGICNPTGNSKYHLL